ncbi:MAG: hypothetical protein ACLQRH_19505, partial [Acidimicrobiales bacterium]
MTRRREGRQIINANSDQQGRYDRSVLARGAPTVILVHGAGDTAGVWRAVQHELATPSQALDVLGRGANPYDLSLVTPHAAVEQAI